MKYLLGLCFLLISFTTVAEYQAIQFLQTNSVSQNVTHTHIVNTSDSSQSFTGTLYSGDGDILGIANTALTDTEIPAKGRLVLTSEDIEFRFGVSAWSGPATLEITGTGAFDVMSKLTNPSGLQTNTNCVRESSLHNIEGFDSQAVSFVRFINIGDSPIVEVIGTLYDQSGGVIGREGQLLVKQLKPRESVWLTRDSISNFIGDTWLGEAYLEIRNPSADLRLLNLNYVESTFVNFSCFESAENPQGDDTNNDDDSNSMTADGVNYRITFVAEWSAETHPTAYPSNAHFSPLVAVTHDSNVEFWASGGTASEAVEDVAELGVTSTISTLITDEISLGNAHDSTVGFNLDSPGTASITVTATEDHDLLTLITMVAPSPDWFVGVSNLDLFVDGVWLDQQLIDLFAYDAGTEEGTGFSLSNAATSPLEPISRITTDPFPTGSPRLGYFQIDRIEE